MRAKAAVLLIALLMSSLVSAKGFVAAVNNFTDAELDELVSPIALYGSSGVMTFIINQQGKVYQSNLGPNTERFARAITEYNPDSGWELVDYRTVLLNRN